MSWLKLVDCKSQFDIRVIETLVRDGVEKTSPEV